MSDPGSITTDQPLLPRLLLINANTSEHVTQRMVARATLATAGRAQVSGATPTFGPAIITSQAENALAAHGVLDVAARHAGAADAVVLAVSLDTALPALREMLDIPVVGMTEAAVLSACMLGQRVGFLTLGPQLLPLYQAVVRGYGVADRVVAWAAPVLPAAYSAGPTEMDEHIAAALEQAVHQMIARDAVDVVVLSGAVLTGYAAMLAPRVPVPLVDAIDAAALAALSMWALRGGRSLPSARRPRGRTVHGVSDALADWFRAGGPPG